MTADEQRLEAIRVYGKWMCCFACIDLFSAILVLWRMDQYWMGLLQCIGPICGMIGGLQYQWQTTLCYLIFLVFKLISNIILLFYASEASQFIILAITVLVTVWIFRFSLTFYQELKKCSEQDIQTIRQMNRER